jgi:hypothetical protein
MKTLDEILDDFTEDESQMYNSEEYEAYKEKILNNIELPSFYTFDDFKPIYTLDLTKTKEDYTVQILDETGKLIDQSFEYFADAYSYIEKDLKGDVEFSKTTRELMGGTLNYQEPPKAGRPVTNTMYFSRTWKDTVLLAKTHYFHFLKIAKQYETNPRNFPLAWNFINGHPAFWIRNANTNNWKLYTNAYITMNVFGSSTGEAEVTLEHGGANTDRTAHYGGYSELEVSAESYESAIIMLARAVHKTFNYDGSRKG